MQDRIISELHEIEKNLRRIGFRQAVIDPVMRALEAESFSLMERDYAEERLNNYFRFLNHKISLIGDQFVNKRKVDTSEEAARLWRHRANFQKGRIEGIMPDSELSAALKFLIDKSFEL